MSGYSKLLPAWVLLLLFATVGSGQRVPLIINGMPTDAFPAVGIVGEETAGGFCTGTLISPTHVLTAAHCAEFLLDIGSPDSGTFEVGGRVYRTASVEILSSYNSFLFTDDVAILVLEEAVNNVEPMDLSTSEPMPGQAVTLVGFGGQGTPEAGSDGSFGEKLIGTTTIDSVTDNEISWEFDETTEANPAPGDSGGPVFIEEAGTFFIAGIVSSGTTASAGLGDTTFSMRVDSYLDWIDETVVMTTVPVEAAPGEETPTEEAPTEETPTEETPTEEAPAEETPAEEAPAEETPAGCHGGTGSQTHAGHGHRGHGGHRGNGNHKNETHCHDTSTAGCQTPVVETPAEDTPAAETPDAEAPDTETPDTDSAASETTTTETPTEAFHAGRRAIRRGARPIGGRGEMQRRRSRPTKAVVKQTGYSRSRRQYR